MATLLTVNGAVVVDDAELESYVKSLYSELESLNSKRISQITTYFKELNGNSYIPQPEEDWQSDLKSSVFFQKIIFTYLFLRSLLKKSSSNLVAFEARDPYFASALKKVFNYASYKTNLYGAVDKSLFYSLLSGDFTLNIDVQYKVDEWEDIELELVVQPVEPLRFFSTPEKDVFAVVEFVDYEHAYKLMELLWEKKVDLKPYGKNDLKDNTYFYTLPQTQKPYVKLTTIYARFIKDTVSLPYKFVIVNDEDLVLYEPVNHSDKKPPIISVSFYSDDMQLSYADLIWGYYKEDTRFLRAILDRALLSTAMGFEVNTTYIQSQKDELEIRPFAVYYSTSDTPAFRPFQLASFDPNVLPVRQLIVNEATNISAITEFIMGLPTSKGRPTAKEVTLKASMNQQVMSTIIERLEGKFISDVVKKLLSLAFQYKMAEIERLLDENELRAVNVYRQKAVVEGKKEYHYLVKELYKGVDVKVEGISGLLRQQDELQTLMDFVSVVSQFGLASYIDMTKVLGKLVAELGFPADIVRQPTQEELVAMAQQQAILNQKQREILEYLMREGKDISKVKPENLQYIANLLIQTEGGQNVGGMVAGG